MATTDNRKTAVLLASCNGEKFIREQMASILQQTCRDLLIYIHDDGSTDGTVRTVRAMLAELLPEDADRIRILHGPPTGSAKANFLWMLSQVEADCYFFSDQDDVWLSDKAEKELGALEKICGTDRQIPACVFSDMYVVDENLSVRSDSFIRDLGRSADRTVYSEVMIDNPAAGCTMLINRALRDLVINSAVDPDRIEMHDQYILALADLCGRVAAVKEPLVYYRQHGTNVMGAGEKESRADKVLRNIRLFTSGEFAGRKADFHRKERLLAGELAKVEAVPEEKKKVLRAMAEIGSKGKLQRMAFYRKNDFSRMSKNLWMRLWV